MYPNHFKNSEYHIYSLVSRWMKQYQIVEYINEKYYANTFSLCLKKSKIYL